MVKNNIFNISLRILFFFLIILNWLLANNNVSPSKNLILYIILFNIFLIKALKELFIII